MHPKEKTSSKPWKYSRKPRKILVIRYQALGDIFATFPFVSALKTKYPESEIDLIVRKDYEHLPARMQLFYKIYALRPTKSGWIVFFSLLRLWPQLFFKRYDLILDLQRNRQTRFLRFFLFPKSWVEFDRFSGTSAMLRLQHTFEQTGLGQFRMDYSFAQNFPKNTGTDELLKSKGWDGQKKLIVLNPAGAFITRNWPLENYSELAKIWVNTYTDMQFVILGVSAIGEKAECIKQAVGDQLINLVGLTTISEAYEIVLKAEMMLTEDSGLGHFAWISEIPTVMMLGSTRSDWTAPFGEHTAYFDSSNLPCGNCMRASCIHQTIKCMEQITVPDVDSKMKSLLDRKSQFGIEHPL